MEVVGLLTTINAEFGRVAMHATRQNLLEAQAQAVGLSLLTVPIPWPYPNVQYEAAFLVALTEAKSTLEVTHIAFGDLFLEDVRAYREAQLKGMGLTPLFPLWGQPTRELAEEMVAGGLQPILTCVDPHRLPVDFAGRLFDTELLDSLPADVDPCGEGGEFHTFAFDGPMFAHPLAIEAGEIVERDGFVFADVLPTS